MKPFLRYALAAIALIVVSSQADAAQCFWVGGTGNWDSVNTTSWASGTGGTPGTCAATGGIPKQAGDTAIFDASSCGSACTITVCGVSAATCPTSSGTLTLTTITHSACTNGCVLDFSAINPNVNLSGNFASSGTGTRTVNMGSGTWTLSGSFGGNQFTIATVTNLTFNANSSTVVLSATSGFRGVNIGTKALNILTIASSTSITTIGYGATATIATLNVTYPNNVQFTGSSTLTITNAFTLAGTSANFCIIQTNGNGVATIAAGAASTITWAAIQGITFTTSSVNATNSFDLTGNTFSGGGGISGPSFGGGGGHIIGG